MTAQPTGLVVSRTPIGQLTQAFPSVPVVSGASLDALSDALASTSAGVVIVDRLLETARELNQIIPPGPHRFIVTGIDAPRVVPLVTFLLDESTRRVLIACVGPTGGSRMNDVVASMLETAREAS